MSRRDLRTPVTGDYPFAGMPRSVLDALGECLRYFANHDRANAAIHCGNVRYSPLTFRVAECVELADPTSLDVADRELLDDVLAHHGTYAEDRGREVSDDA